MDAPSVMMEEQKLMSESKYRVYMSNIDKALKNFEYSSEWADLISALGKLNKAILSNTTYQIIPRRIKISKRLAQCMHPALPSGVHLKALETYDAIFHKTGADRLATELFIYSAGLFPLLSYAAMNVRPTLLGIYEMYFVPLGEKLRPALSGFLSGVLPGYDSTMDHFERTNSLLTQVCAAVSPSYFYTCLWECIATNAPTRLAAVSYLLDHFNRRLSMRNQTYIMGKNHDVMMSGLCACLNDAVILVQRNSLEFLLLGFPMHTKLLSTADRIKLVTNGLNTILRRDMSLNRRLYSWLLGNEISSANQLDEQDLADKGEMSYFDFYSKDVLIRALKWSLKISLLCEPIDLKPYKIMVVLLDKVEIGPAVLDFVLCDVIRTMTLPNDKSEVIRSANFLFGTFDPAYIWNYMTQLYEAACKTATEPTSRLTRNIKNVNNLKITPEVDSGPPCLGEVCYLTEFLLEIISLELYNETTRVYLPRVFLAITQMLTVYSEVLTHDEVIASLKLCMKIVSRVQPMISPSKVNQPLDVASVSTGQKPSTTQSAETTSSLEKSKSDSKINQSAFDDEPIRRANSNQNMGKKSPKKTKKSKSYSRLLEIDKKDSSPLSSALSHPDLDIAELKSTKHRSSPPRLEKQPEEPVTNKEELKSQFKLNLDVDGDGLPKEVTATTMQEFSILEKCIRQFEVFYDIYLSRNILQITKKSNGHKISLNCHLNDSAMREEVVEEVEIERTFEIDKMFQSLKMNNLSRTCHLQALLNKTISHANSFSDISDLEYKDSSPSSDTDDSSNRLGKKYYDFSAAQNLITMRLDETLKQAVKLASNLLVEMSTFPNYNQRIVIDSADGDIPYWLKVLSLVACYTKSDKDLQITCISTLFELISLLKSQLEHTANPGVTCVVMLPLLKFSHVNYLETRTRVFYVLTSVLWDYLDEPQVDPSQISALLYQLHNCLDNGLVENVIGNRITNAHMEWTETSADHYGNNSKKRFQGVQFDMSGSTDRLSSYKMDRLSDMRILCMTPSHVTADCSSFLSECESKRFKKFSTLWHLGRDAQNQRSFDKTLLKVFDHLALPHHVSIRVFTTKWLQESLLRGDLNRLLSPLLVIMLAPSTKRVSVVHVSSLNQKDGDNEGKDLKEPDDGYSDIVVERDVYAISSEDGNVKYHMEVAHKKKSPIRSLQKKFFGVTIGNKNKTSNYISDKVSMPSLETTSSNISLIVNPLDNSMDAENLDSKSLSQSSTITAKQDDVMTEFISSSEDSEDETSTENDSEVREQSLDQEVVSSSQESEIKRYVGDCDHVAEILTEHDRTKNRKTYHVTKTGNSGSRVIEKIECSLAGVSEGIQDFEESTPAEEYFSTPSSAVENFVNDLLDRVSESQLSDDGSTSNPPTELKNSPESNHLMNDSDKRMSTTSKTSTESASSCFESTILEKESTSEPICDNASANESDGNEEMKAESLRVDEKKVKKSKRINWDKSFEKGKQNVEILRQAALEGNSALVKNYFSHHRKKHLIHPFHTHMLVYCDCYDTHQVLYALQTLRNLIACDCRTFLCLSITTALSNPKHKQKLMRHRKCIFGKGFSGSMQNTEFNQAYRGCMYLEGLVTSCLYYARSYFRKETESEQPPKGDDIIGNGKVQLASMEILALILNELISIVKDMGKGLACYIADLMTKCKLQKILLHCLVTSVHLFGGTPSRSAATFTDDILSFNCPGSDNLHTESIQVQLLQLMLAVIKLEHEVAIQKGDEKQMTPNGGTAAQTPSTPGTPNQQEMSGSPTRQTPSTPTNVKYLPNCSISQQPMFLSAVLSALQTDKLRHLHINWTNMITSSLNCLSSNSLTNVVISVIHQICGNIDRMIKDGKYFHLPPDYIISQLEAVTILCHYCLLDTAQQTSLSHLFNQTYPSTSSVSQSSNTGQLLTNIVHSFLSSPQSNLDNSQTKNANLLAARNAVLSHLPRIVSSIATLWDMPEDNIRQIKKIKQQLLEFLSPISLHHGTNFLAAIAITWQERKHAEDYFLVESNSDDTRKNSLTGLTAKALPQANDEQLNLVQLVSRIRVMPMDSFVSTLHQVVKSPPPVHSPIGGGTSSSCIEVNALELFYFYMKSVHALQLSESWSSLLSLLKDGLGLAPPAQFVLLAILNEFVQRSPQMPFTDKKDIRELHDITTRLVEALSNIAGSGLEQTTWLRRNLAVKEDMSLSSMGSDASSLKDIGKDNHSLSSASIQGLGIQQYYVQAQSVLAAILANLLDVAYGSQEKDKVVTVVTTLMYNVIPYLKNHTARNIPSFYACSNLLATLSGYQYTRKAWRKDMFDLVLDLTFFQMDGSCLPFWKQILDNLMTYDNTTFRELMSRVSLTQTGGLNIFSSREQEYEQRAFLLKRLAFVIYCSELDQYHKYMPEIQEQLANSLRLPSVVPSVQAAVFLCFRVLLLRMSPDHMTSLWPTIIAEMVQVFLAMEQELKADTEETAGGQIRVLLGIDAPWIGANGVLSQNHLNYWRMVQLEIAKLLELGCVLPATQLPHFQMYRWAFVGGNYDCPDGINGHSEDAQFVSSVFVPHVRRISRLMDLRYTCHSPKPHPNKGTHIVLTCQSISTLQDLYGFFSTLGISWPPLHYGDNEKELANCLAEIEAVLANDFLEKMQSMPASR